MIEWRPTRQRRSENRNQIDNNHRSTHALFFFFFWSRFYASALSGRDTRDPVSKELMGGERVSWILSYRCCRCNVFRCCISLRPARIIYINPLVFRWISKKYLFSNHADSSIFVYLKFIILYIYLIVFIPRKFNVKNFIGNIRHIYLIIRQSVYHYTCNYMSFSTCS